MYTFKALIFGGSPYVFTEPLSGAPHVGQAILDTSTGKYYSIAHEVVNEVRTYIVYIYPNQ